MNAAAKIGLGVVGVGAVGGLGYLAYNAIRNQKVGVDERAGDFLSEFDSNGNDKINVEYESTTREQKTSSHSSEYGTYYTNYTETRSMKPLALRADSRPNGNGDGEATFEEILKVIKTYDKGDGSKHPAGDGILGGAERRNFNNAYGVDVRTR